MVWRPCGRAAAAVTPSWATLAVVLMEAQVVPWRQRYAELESEQVRQFKQLQDELTKLKRLVVDLSLVKMMLQESSQKSLRPSRRRIVVKYLQTC